MIRRSSGRHHGMADEWRADQAQHRVSWSRTGTPASASSLLRSRARAAGSSVEGLPAPFQLPGARTAAGFSADPAAINGMPSTAHVGFGIGKGTRKFGSAIRRRGALGAGDHDDSNPRGSASNGFVKKEAESSTMRRLWKEAKREKGHLAMAAVCLMVSSSANLMAPSILARVIDRASKRGSRDGGACSSEMVLAGRQISDRVFFIGALGVFAAGSLASWGRVYALAMATAGVAGRLRARLFAALMLQEKEFFDEKAAGELTPILSEDVDLSSLVFTERMASILRSLNSSVNASVALLSISPSLTLVSLSTVPIVGSAAMLYYKHVRKLSMRLRELEAEAQAFAQARLANVRTVRAFANEKLEAERFEQMLGEAKAMRTVEAGAQGVFRGSLFGMVGVSLMAVLWVGGSRVGDGSMTAGQLTSFAGYTGWVGLGFSGLATANANLTKGLASAERVFALVDRVPAVALDDGIQPAGDVRGGLEFRDVWFQYHARNKAVLQGVSLEIKQGEVLALTGPSGEGKSTVASLITRLYEPHRGCITLDGIDISTVNPSWLRRQIGVVDQEPVLFAGTIADNIRYGVPLASDEYVEEAARQANAHDFITGFPDGYDTRVGDGGKQLSGGQKQRIAIARAVLKNPPVLILDEATSALDVESERLVSEALDRVMASRTVLVIAHRQSTVSKADNVAVLQNGRVTEYGTYAELMANEDGILANVMAGKRSGNGSP